MKNLSTGTGLAILAGAALAYPFVSSLAPNANAVGIGTTAVSAVAAAATAQGAPTIVWYQAMQESNPNLPAGTSLFRAWSNGRVEVLRGFWFQQQSAPWCWSWQKIQNTCNGGDWQVVVDPSSGYSARFDGNSDDAIDGVDLGQMLAAWGPVTRNPVPPSDCPLNLINP